MINELRVGNLVLYNNIEQTIFIHDFISIYDDKDICKPIPLTEERFLKFHINYECVPNAYRGRYYKFALDGVLYYFFTDHNRIEKHGSSKQYHFVHQLQNLYFILIGSEL